jgi:hypothetical protein
MLSRTRAGVIDTEAAALAQRLMGMRVQPFLFQRAPEPAGWRAQLAHRTRYLPDPDVCRAQVPAALGWGSEGQA